jgi:hypothetical protein
VFQNDILLSVVHRSVILSSVIQHELFSCHSTKSVILLGVDAPNVI